MPNVKPRRGEEALLAYHTARFLHFSGDALQTMRDALGVEIPPETVSELETAGRVYFSTINFVDRRPTIPQQRAAIEALREKADSFCIELRDLDFASRGSLVDVHELLERAEQDVLAISSRIEWLLSQPVFSNHSKKRPKYQALYFLVSQLMGIYEKLTRKKAGGGGLRSDVTCRSGERLSGPFILFVQTFLNGIGDHPDTVLPGRLSKIIKLLRKHQSISGNKDKSASQKR
ncbi:MAG: hypothetical protein WAW37_05825 [Syntrophobacteraceae bacterium]